MSVLVKSHVQSVQVNKPLVARLASNILSAVGELSSELDLTFIGDRRMRRLNRLYRDTDQTTDVLAFAARDVRIPRAVRLTPWSLGDVVIALPTAVRQARRENRSLNDEIAALLVHGILHLCGYDHERNKREARRMHRRERTILRRLGKIPRLAHATKSTKNI